MDSNLQRKISDIVVDLEFLAHGLGPEASARRVSEPRQHSEDDRGQREILAGLERILTTTDRGRKGDQKHPETRIEWLRRQQDLIASLADQITRNALESCHALSLADANANVSAFSEYRDADLRKLAAELTLRGEQLKNRLARDRAGVGFDPGQCEVAFHSGSRSGTLAVADEISQNALDHGNGEMF